MRRTSFWLSARFEGQWGDGWGEEEEKESEEENEYDVIEENIPMQDKIKAKEDCFDLVKPGIS